jgi:hypothetical protein
VFPTLPAYPMTAVILRDILQCVGLFVTQQVAPYGEKLDRVLYGSQCPATADLSNNGT